MRNHRLQCSLTAAALAGLTACAISQPSTLAGYLPYSGTPVNHFTSLGPVGWDVPSDSKLLVVVFVGASEAYLLTLRPPCRVRSPPSTNLIQLTSSAVYARLDSIRVNDGICLVTEIRPIDLRRMRQNARVQQAATSDQATTPAAPSATPTPVTPQR